MKNILPILIMILATSCATNKGVQEKATFAELNKLLEEHFEKNLNCGELSQFKFVTKLELAICLEKFKNEEKQDVQLSYKDLPKRGPLTNHVFSLISTGIMMPKSPYYFGSNDYLHKEEVETIINRLKKE